MRLPLLEWQPPQKIALFPSVRRRRMIERTARAAAATKNPENTIQAWLKRLRESHERRHIPTDLARADVDALERALRMEIEAILRRSGRSA